MRRLLSALLVVLAFSAENAIARPSPSEVPVVRNPRQASDLALHPWEDLFMPGPTVLALLGQLMVISSKEDFSLVESVPRDGYKYIRHPESFHASLLQLSNDGREAFVNAHKNMDDIQQYMQKVPVQVKTAIEILAQSSPEMIKLLLPMTLNRIQDYVRTCVQLSTESQSKFASPVLLMGEILEATISRKEQYEKKMARVQVELLKQGIILLAKVREQWIKQVELFSKVALSAEVVFNRTLSAFLNYAKIAEQIAGQVDAGDRKFFLDIVQEEAVDINMVAYFYYSISSIYMDVSTRFLLNRLADFPQLLATSNDADRQRLLITLNNQANEAQEAIKLIAQRKREDYPRLIDARKRELQDIVDRLGGLNETTTIAFQMGSATQM